MINTLDLENNCFLIEYKIFSNLGDKGSYRFSQTIYGELSVSDEMGNNKKTIGKLTGEKLLLNEARNHNWDSQSIFDNEAHTLEIGEAIYDFDYEDWHDNIKNKFDEEIYENDLLILSRIEILPKYQGKGIGQKWIKDFYINFIQGCGLMALKVFPLQCESDYTLGRDQNWCDEMKYSNMEKGGDAFESLLKFYLKIGFQIFPEISKKIVFINPFLRNEKFEQIKFDL
ncbi:hypothetical protein N0B40_18470 [Chryseobacterium oranimense]|uniref:hypothetical protein n=1 Tax=Chryseobacterium oranimense TaxID=421058 RepID=UPI0021AE5BDE|nr:hypothetical protein [Chryseobacterium oranimense]UWX60371.1 hypothetical protein N0B40_18470 [Chryseobacterium oranimense]